MLIKNRPIHYSSNDKINGTKYRSVLCDSRVVYLEYETQRKKSQHRRQNAIDDTIRLRTDFKACDQGYYTRDKKKVTCKNCKRLLKGEKRNGWFGEQRWKPMFVGDRKHGCWLVIGDGVVRKIFVGANRKNNEAAQRAANEYNREMIRASRGEI